MSLGTGLGKLEGKGLPHRPPRRLQRPDARRHALRRRDGARGRRRAVQARRRHRGARVPRLRRQANAERAKHAKLLACGLSLAIVMTTDICTLSAVELARLIRARELSARDVVAAHLTQIDRVNPTVNAIVTLVAEQAMERARAADEALARGAAIGPLHGLPIAHKDLQPTKGIRTTFGSPIYKDFVPAEDSLLVERLRRAGAIVVGKTNTPEFGAGSQTFNPVFGATLNPYDLTKTCGGSSGGAAVALACGMLPIADGSDMGGSLRNPASFCNVVGLRPSPGRVPVVAGGDGVVDAERRRPDGAQRRRRRAVAERDRRSRCAIADRARRAGRAVCRRRSTATSTACASRGGRISAACRSIPASEHVVNAQRARLRVARLHRRGGGAGLHRLRRRCSRRCARWRSSPASRRSRRGAPRPGEGHDPLGDRARRAADADGDREGRDEANRALSPHAAVHGALRVLRAADRRRCRRSTSTQPYRHRDRRRRDGDLHRLDEVLLLHLDRRQPRDLGAVRLHAGRAAGRPADRRAPSATTGACCRWRTRSNRRAPGSGNRRSASCLTKPRRSRTQMPRQRPTRSRPEPRWSPCDLHCSDHLDRAAPACRSAAISSPLNPASRSTSSVCSPSCGARRDTSGGVALILIGEPSVLQLPERRVIGFDHHLARDDLRIGEHLRVVVDRPARDVVRLEQRQPVRARLRAR